MREEAIRLGDAGTLVGILTHPDTVVEGAESALERPAVLLLNAGIVHRVGPNRLYVKIARLLAGLGFLVLRFDLSGVGDSEMRNDHLPFRQSAILETQAAMDYLAANYGSARFMLLGLCSGAKVSFKTACIDTRVVDTVLINCWGHLHDENDEELNEAIRQRALTRHYWRIALFSSFRAKNWLKTITGKVDYQRVLSMLAGLPPALLLRLKQGKGKTGPAIKSSSDLELLAGRKVRCLHIYSEGDEGLDYFEIMLGKSLKQLPVSKQLAVEFIAGINHTFTLQWAQQHILEIIENWVRAADFSREG